MQFNLTPAQRALQAKARQVAHGPIADRAAEIDRSEQYPWDNVALLKEAGFFGMTIPAAYGGRDASYLDAVLVIEEMAKCCGVERPHRRRGQYGRDRRDHEIRQRVPRSALRLNLYWLATSQRSASPSRTPAALPAR